MKRINFKVCNKYTAFSFTSALCLTVVCYFANNLPLFTGESLDQQFLNQKVCEWVGYKEQIDYNDAFFVNVSYDKELVPVKRDSDTIGNDVVTNRRKLYELLSLLKESNVYKYVIVDLMFSKGDCTAYDDSLYLLMKEMDKLVIVDHDSVDLARSYLKEKSAIAEYYATITATNFVRYEYLRGDRRYIPTKVFEELYPEKTISRYGWRWLSVYTSQNKLCQNGSFITFDTAPFSEYKSIGDSIVGFSGEKKAIVQKVYYNLGHDLVDQICPEYTKDELIREKITPATKGKYVIISNITEDVHDTYAGQKPGCIILYRALQNLEKGNTMISYSHILLWFCIFFIVAVFTIRQRSILSYIPFLKSCKVKCAHYILDIFSFSSLFFVVEVLEYIVSHVVYSITIPVLYFTIVKLLVNYKNVINK